METTGAVTPQTPIRDSTIAFIALLRGAAALLVVYCHLVGGPVEEHKLDWMPYTLVRNYVLLPFGISRNFGYFGVVLFFLISGFIITHVAQREDHLAFVVKRLFRIYPPLVMALILTVTLYHVYTMVSGNTLPTSTRTLSDTLWSATLFDGLNKDVHGVLDVAWTLGIEITFYAVCLALLPFIRRAPLVAISLTCAISLLVTHATSGRGSVPLWNVAGHEFELLPCFTVGMVLYYYFAHRLSLGVTCLALIGTWIVLLSAIHAIQPFLVGPDYAVPLSLALCTGLFALCMANTDRLRLPRFAAFVSDISYSLYLYHLPIGGLVIFALYPHTGFTVALLAALVACFAISWASHVFVERPFQEFARFLLRLRARRPERMIRERSRIITPFEHPAEGGAR